MMTILLYGVNILNNTYESVAQGEGLVAPTPLPEGCIEVTTLDGWTMVQPPPVPSPNTVLEGYVAWLPNNLSPTEFLALSSLDTVLRKALQDWGNPHSGINQAYVLAVIEAVKQQTPANLHPALDTLIANVTTVVETEETP